VEHPNESLSLTSASDNKKVCKTSVSSVSICNNLFFKHLPTEQMETDGADVFRKKDLETPHSDAGYFTTSYRIDHNEV
jgi:hypothetical protein